jgi:hypothetical protein
MVVIVHFVSFTQISGVESLADIAADFPGIFPTGHTAMLVFTGRFCGQRLRRWSLVSPLTLICTAEGSPSVC